MSSENEAEAERDQAVTEYAPSESTTDDPPITTAPSWSRQIINVLTDMDHMVATNPNEQTRDMQEHNMKMMNTALSTIMLMASGQTGIPDAYFECTDRFLRSIKCENGIYPNNVQQLLEYMRAHRPVHLLTSNESQTKSSGSKRSRIPVPIRSHRSVDVKPSARRELELKKRSLSCLNIQSEIPSPASLTSFHTGFNKIFHRLLFPQYSLMEFAQNSFEESTPSENTVDWRSTSQID